MREAQVEDDAVVDGQSHQHPDQVILSQRARVGRREPVAARLVVVHEHPVAGLATEGARTVSFDCRGNRFLSSGHKTVNSHF